MNAIQAKTAATVCIVGICLIGANAARAHAAEVQLRPEIHTQKNLLLLGDIAEIFSTNSQESAALAAVELMPAPTAGVRLKIAAREIQDILAMRGVNLTNLQFTGAAHVVVIAGADPAEKQNYRRPSRQATQQAKRAAADAIVKYLQSQAGDEEWEAAVELDDSQVVALAAAGEPVKVLGGAAPWTGSQTFELRLTSAEGASRMEVTAQVSLPPTVVIAVHLLPKGTIVRTSDVRVERLKRGVSVGDLFQSVDDVAGKEAVRNIAVGQPLDQNLVHAPLLVRSGEVVTVFGRNGGITVRMPARARENGSEGDLVSVESLTDRQTFLARVSALHEVEVFAGATTTAPSSGAAAPRSQVVRTSMN